MWEISNMLVTSQPLNSGLCCVHSHCPCLWLSCPVCYTVSQCWPLIWYIPRNGRNQSSGTSLIQYICMAIKIYTQEWLKNLSKLSRKNLLLSKASVMSVNLVLVCGCFITSQIGTLIKTHLRYGYSAHMNYLATASNMPHLIRIKQNICTFLI